jgi:hypothetical protein
MLPKDSAQRHYVTVLTGVGAFPCPTTVPLQKYVIPLAVCAGNARLLGQIQHSYQSRFDGGEFFFREPAEVPLLTPCGAHSPDLGDARPALYGITPGAGGEMDREGIPSPWPLGGEGNHDRCARLP